MKTVLAILLFMFVLRAAYARAPDDADPALAPWFQGLTAPNGQGCCSVADCRTADYRTTSEGYEVWIETTAEGENHPRWRWLPVPPDRVLDHKDNPTGRAVVCYLPSLGIICFVRPAET